MENEKKPIFEQKKGVKPFVAAVALSLASLFPGVSQAEQASLEKASVSVAEGDVESAKKVLGDLTPKTQEHLRKAFDMVDKLGDSDMFSDGAVAEHPSLKEAIATVAQHMKTIEIPDTSQFDTTPGSATKDVISGRTSRNTSGSGK